MKILGKSINTILLLVHGYMLVTITALMMPIADFGHLLFGAHTLIYSLMGIVFYEGSKLQLYFLIYFIIFLIHKSSINFS